MCNPWLPDSADSEGRASLEVDINGESLRNTVFPWFQNNTLAPVSCALRLSHLTLMGGAGGTLQFIIGLDLDN